MTVSHVRDILCVIKFKVNAGSYKPLTSQANTSLLIWNEYFKTPTPSASNSNNLQCHLKEKKKKEAKILNKGGLMGLYDIPQLKIF